MARHLPLLDAAQHRVFDQHLTFNQSQQRRFFSSPDWAIQLLRILLAPNSRGGFVLQVGYFKATWRFFLVDRFLLADRAYVQHRYYLGRIACGTQKAQGAELSRHPQFISGASAGSQEVDISRVQVKEPGQLFGAGSSW